MLEDLNIKDFALIDEASLEFNKGFTILSGETGAGKSILIGALSFLLGGRGGIEQIRSGCGEAHVSGTFTVENKEALHWLSDHDIELEDGRILLRRQIRSTGKSSAWIGGSPVTRSELTEFSSYLVDIHGQHEHQSLMRVSEHRRFLDSYAGITAEVSAFTSVYTELCQKRQLLAELNSNDATRRQKIDMLSFAVKEIEDAKLKAGEDDELEEEETRLSSFERLYSGIEDINNLLSGADEAVVPILKRLRQSVSHVAELDKKISPLYERVEAAFYEISDISDEFRNYERNLVFDPERLTAVQERLETLHKLKKKYASSSTAPISEVIAYCQSAKTQLEKLGGSEADRTSLTKEIESLVHTAYKQAVAISASRAAAAFRMSVGVEQILQKLGMAGTKFSVNVEKFDDPKMLQCTQFGIDSVEFLISANPGSPLLPLAKIASGGELSRVMLAIKTILAQSDMVSTLIFDEIDTGIGGQIAVSVGDHMKMLADKKQILCITHLASIAVYADTQIKIQKAVSDGKTSTHVRVLSEEERVLEIARMLSGDAASPESLEHARMMLKKFGG